MISMHFIILIEYNFGPYDVFLAIATNIPVILKTGFVVQGHISTPKGYVCDPGPQNHY